LIDPRHNIPSKPANATQPGSLTKNNAAIAVAVSVVRIRAYELYELRGRIDGYAEQDWYQAVADLAATGRETSERRIVNKAREARAA